MKKIKIIEGVVAEYKGRYWGVQEEDARSTCSGFGEFDKASMCDPRFCKKPTDMTWTPTDGRYNRDYEELNKAKLVFAKKTITIEFELLNT